MSESVPLTYVDDATRMIAELIDSCESYTLGHRTLLPAAAIATRYERREAAVKQIFKSLTGVEPTARELVDIIT